MNSTTANKTWSWPRVLAVSVAVQATLLLVFYVFEPLRVNRLDQQVEDVQKLDKEARERFQRLEKEREELRESVAINNEDAEKLAKEREQESAKQMIPLLENMEDMREALDQQLQKHFAELDNRTAADVSLNMYVQLHPLATQLVQSARVQQESLTTLSPKNTEQAASELLNLIERNKETLITPPVFEQLTEAHQRVRDAQHTSILELDQAQATYPDQTDRIRHENHVEYLVNLQRDRISNLLNMLQPLDPGTMNAVPSDISHDAPAPAAPEFYSADSPVTELHQSASRLFEEIQQRFEDSRAAELAVKRHTSFLDVMSSVHAPSPTTSFDPSSLAATPETAGQLNAYTEAVGRARKDIQAMWASARNMAGQSGGPITDSGGSPHGAGAGRSTSLAQAAARADGGRFADMTGFMYHSGPGEKGFTSGHSGGRDITRETIRSGYVERGAGTPGAKPPLLSEDLVLAQSLPGRKFSPQSSRTGWLYIDTWYIIGPWENRSRIDFHQQLPPETLVDLDAEYIGKQDMPLRWTFHQSDNIRIKPPEEMEAATYFGYTEVYFEEETEMLVAVASDDAAKVWLNDTLIWQDSGLGPWRLDEGFRRVVFRQGFNSVLLRLENGPVTATFSFLLCPPDLFTRM